MTIKSDFLSGTAPWRKTFIKRHGEVESKLVKPPFHVTSYRENAKDLKEFHEQLKGHAKQGHALLRGLLRQPLDNEPRAKKMDKRAKTKLLILDIDGTRTTDNPVEFFQEFLGFPDVDMIITYTSSYGIKPGMRANIIVELATETSFRDLANLLWWRQLQNPELADEIRLDVSGSLLLPVIDTASCVPAQVFTIAPPKCSPASLDPFVDNQDARYEFHTGKGRTLGILDYMPDSRDDVMSEKAKLITALRIERGMSSGSESSRETSVYIDKNTGEEWTVVKNPPPATVTAIHDQGDFIRLDLNGGDSQSTWHLRGSIDWVYSFKHYTRYPMDKLLPEYYQSLVEERRVAKSEEAEAVKHSIDKGESVTFVGIDQETEDYLCAIIDRDTTWEDVHTFTKVRSVESWLDSNDVTSPFGTVPPLYKVVFDPHKPFFDPVNRTLNRFTPPAEVPLENRDISLRRLNRPVHDLLYHVVGGDTKMMETFLDWVAWIYQRRIAPQSAWLLHGCQGTGKDMTFLLLKKILGDRYCRAVMPASLNEQYNGWAEDANLVFINEIDSRVFKGSNLSAKLNDYITADRVNIRRMRTDSYETPNLTGYIFASNRADAVELPPGDRRFHVPPRQEVPLIRVMAEEDIKKIANISGEDLGMLRSWFGVREFDEARLRRPVLTAAKQVLADSAQPAATRLVGQLRDGRWAEVVSNLESYGNMFNDRGLQGAALILETFFRDMEVAVSSMKPKNKNFNPVILITREELRALFASVCDPRLSEMAPGKFRQFLLHNHMFEIHETVPRRRGGKSRRGVLFPLPTPEEAPAVLEDLRSAGFLPELKQNNKLELVK